MNYPILLASSATVRVGPRDVTRDLCLQLRGPKAVVVGDPVPLLAPIFGFGLLVSGRIQLNGRPLEEARRTLGLCPLDPPLPGDWTPHTYVAWSARLAGANFREADAVAHAACKEVGLDASKNVQLHRLGVVPRRLTLIAHGIVTDPAVLVVESPLTGLPKDHAEFVLGVLERVTEGRGSLITTPLFEPGSVADRLARSADELVLLEDGEVLEQGSPDELVPKSHSRQAAVLPKTPDMPDAHPAPEHAPSPQGLPPFANLP